MFGDKTLPTSGFQRQIVTLLNTSENSKCFDCQTRLPSYANLTIGTFVCMLCSSLLRELGHCVKSIANPSFTAEELHIMTQGGNNEAAKVWLNNWNQQQANISLRLQDVASIKIHLREKYIIKRWYREPISSRTLSFSTSSLSHTPSSNSFNSNPRAAPYKSGTEKKFTKPIFSANEVDGVKFVRSLPRPKKRTDIQRSGITSLVDEFSSLDLQQRQSETLLKRPQAVASNPFEAFVPQKTNPSLPRTFQKHTPTPKPDSQNSFDDNFTSFPFGFSTNFYQTQEPPLTQSAPQVNQADNFLSKPYSALVSSSFSSASSLQNFHDTNPFTEDVFAMERNLSKSKSAHCSLFKTKESSTGSDWIAFS